MDWRNDVPDAKEFVDSLRSDVFQDRVYVFTPKGKLVDMPTGSTPIDFAYHIHTDVGDRCRGARVNGSLVSLDYQLKTGDRVEIITAKRGGPSRDWLNPNLGYVKTQRARTKIKQWFKKQDREANIAQGREIVERELHRLSLDAMPHDAVMKLFDFEKVDDFFEKIGSGDISSQAIVSKVIEADRKANPPPEEPLPFVPVSRPEVADLIVRGTGGMLTQLAKCCRPVPGDPIIGFVTRGRGVMIHHQQLREHRAQQRGRAVDRSVVGAQSAHVSGHHQDFGLRSRRPAARCGRRGRRRKREHEQRACHDQQEPGHLSRDAGNRRHGPALQGDGSHRAAAQCD